MDTLDKASAQNATILIADQTWTLPPRCFSRWFSFYLLPIRITELPGKIFEKLLLPCPPTPASVPFRVWPQVPLTTLLTSSTRDAPSYCLLSAPLRLCIRWQM